MSAYYAKRRRKEKRKLEEKKLSRGNSENRLGSDLDNVKKPASCIDTATAPATFAGGLRTPACKDWAEDHVTLAALGTSKFIKAPQAQRLFYALQTALVDTPYRAHGKTDQSCDVPERAADHRKPAASDFLHYFETLYCPMMFRLLFGKAGDEEIQPHVAVLHHQNVRKRSLFTASPSSTRTSTQGGAAAAATICSATRLASSSPSSRTR